MSLEDGSFCYPQPLLWQLLISSQLQLFFFCKFITKRNNKKEKGEKGSNDLWKQARGTIIWAGPTGEIHSHVSEREGIQGFLLLLVCLFLLPPLFPLSRFHFHPPPLLPPSRRRGRASERASESSSSRRRPQRRRCQPLHSLGSDHWLIDTSPAITFPFHSLCAYAYIIPPIPILAPWFLAPFCPFRFPRIPYRQGLLQPPFICSDSSLAYPLSWFLDFFFQSGSWLPLLFSVPYPVPCAEVPIL